jgi:O-antigen ligase
LLWRIITGGVVLIPMFVSVTGKDAFRLPKELLFRVEAILVIAIGFFLFATKQILLTRTWKTAGFLIPAAIVGWSFVTMLVATNRVLSVSAFLWIAGWAAIFLATTSLATERRVSAVYAIVIPAVVNSVIVLMQETGLWNPFYRGKSLEHIYHTALIGNPNDIGTFLALPAIASLALVFADKSRRALNITVTSVLAIAAVANHTLTALIALGVGSLAVLFVVSRKRSIVAAVVLALIGIALVRFYPPLRFRYELGSRFAREGNYDSIMSGRIMPYVSSTRMFLDHPLTGVGPGCFKWEFFPYKLRAAARYGKLITTLPSNFGEVHNDHLQILAESGLPGYLLFVAAIVVIAAGSFRARAESTPESDFSRIASFPLAAGFAVLAIGQFPLELATCMAATIYLFALCRGWQT